MVSASNGILEGVVLRGLYMCFGLVCQAAVVFWGLKTQIHVAAAVKDGCHEGVF